MSRFAVKARRLLAWALSPAGERRITTFVAAATSLYTALHRAGL